MKYTDEVWAEKKRKGLGRYLLIDGILIMGGPFAVVLQVAGYFLFPGNAQTFGEYFGDSITWIRFFFHATLFGLAMGYVNWRRAERSFAKPETDGQNTL